MVGSVENANICGRSSEKLPAKSGVLTGCLFPEDIRVDTWVSTGTEISQYFDPDKLPENCAIPADPRQCDC